ncbi:helix-turn-helix domain-containing protein [Litorilituus lipolyticus]|uniref:AraC family transcriptional regulator n=1 Tax=Litorilituus lipolyticus TaxID=2491017 RepID=A0A502KR24_9GAMM|nr:helix-turn-helix transcriptional regulator [Litorilituus lipolyticus]TPH13966.1 AraC family transcriptional regulator [Litorilituus lipolyticus]
MEVSNTYTAILFISLLFLIAQVFVREKQTSHILFALFCGSIAIMATKKISGETIGAYQYLIGMGACATCNGYWLLSRSLFRTKDAIQAPHLFLAIAIGLLIMASQGYLFVQSNAFISSENNVAPHLINELTILLSSTVIMLSFWEGCRGFRSDSKKGQSQRLLFLATFGLAVGLSKLSQGMLVNSPETKELLSALIILFVLTNTQILMIWRFKKEKLQTTDSNNNELCLSQLASDKKITVQNGNKMSEPCPVEQELASKIEALLKKQSLYLTANLKVADIARELDVSEYKVSHVLRHHLKAKNFNQYVNELRIKHAQKILSDPNKKAWSILVVGLESGFASVGPFTRTFKLITGFTPNQYRQQALT